jgi:hypothetical protein
MPTFEMNDLTVEYDVVSPHFKEDFRGPAEDAQFEIESVTDENGEEVEYDEDEVMREISEHYYANLWNYSRKY